MMVVIICIIEIGCTKEFDDGAFNIEFIRELEEFIKFAILKSRSSKIRCPCAKCKKCCL